MPNAMNHAGDEAVTAPPLPKGNPSRILVVVTAGGSTNAEPLFQLASLLAPRGLIVDFATLDGWASWTISRPYVTNTFVVGPSIPQRVQEQAYLDMSKWHGDPRNSWPTIFGAKTYLDSTWPSVYRGLKGIMDNTLTRPDLILADYLVDAAKDMSVEYGVPLVLHHPQMPVGLLPAPHIPGTPGLQVDVLTSEHATIKQRIKNACVIYSSLPYYLGYLRNLKRMRASLGVTRSLPTRQKPDHLCLVNSCFGIEVAKDIPPNVAAVGPILSDTIAPLPNDFQTFLTNKSRVLYIALGTHVLFSHLIFMEILVGAIDSLSQGSIDGIIWSASHAARRQLDMSATSSVPVPSASNSKLPRLTVSMTLTELFQSKLDTIKFTTFAPQRSLLHDPRISIFLSHVGASSTNEAIFAGKPLITLPAYFDQIQNAMRLRDAGVSVPLDKEVFRAEQVTSAIAHITHDMDTQGPISINVERIKTIARIASRRKHLAADLIEEYLADAKFRQKEQALPGRKARAMHLQPADARMPIWKARNWDLYGLLVLAVVGSLGLVATAVAVPLSLM